MHIPDTLFVPQLQKRKSDPDPIVRSLTGALRDRCESCFDPQSETYIDEIGRKADFWTTRSGGRILPKAIEQLAVGGLLIDDRYTQKAIAIFRAIVDHRIVEACGGANYGRPYRTWRDNCLDAGVSSGGLAIGLDLLRPALSPEDRTRFGAYTLPFIDYLLDNPPDPEEKRPDWNMAAIGLIGMGLLGLVLRSLGVLDEARFARALALAKKRSLLFLEKGHDGQGAFYEGPAYGSATVHYLAPFALALARCNDRDLVDHPGWALLANGLIHELIPGTGRPNPLNDCGDQFQVEWLALVAAEQKNGLAQWLWQRIDNPPQNGETWQMADSMWANTLTRYLLYYNPAIAPVSPEQAGLPRVQHFKNRGLIDIRSGWERDDFFCSFLCDVFPAGGHRQADRNHFALHALGESFAIDSGYCLDRLPDTTEVLRLGALGEAHNLPLVHGDMQRRGTATGDGIRHAELDTPFAFIESEAGQSHRNVERFTRRALCLPSSAGDPFCLIIVDRLVPEPGERPLLSWLLHTAPGNQIDLQRDSFTLTGARLGNHCDVHIATPWPGRWKVETFFDHPRWRSD